MELTILDQIQQWMQCSFLDAAMPAVTAVSYTHLFPMVDLKKANEEIRALSVKYGLEVNPEDVIENINVSTQQRVEILKMLYREAEILIFDAVSYTHLDVYKRQRRRLCSGGRLEEAAG